MTLRIANYNIRGGLGMDGARSIERIAEVIRSLEADIVCLQEVHQNLPWSGFADQPRRLRRLLGREVIFQRNLSLGFGGFGNAIVVNSPAQRVRRHKLPAGREPRGCLEASLKTRVGDLTVFCAHLGLTEGERLAQTERVAELARGAGTPVVVCGDWNEGPNAGRVPLLMDWAGLRDSGENGASTYPSDAPRARIDYIFCGGSLILEDYQTVVTNASDHYPISVNIKPAV